MRKYLAATIAASTVAMAAPAFAQNDVHVNAGTATSVELACMKAAVDARETAVIQARTQFHAALTAALTARKTSLIAAHTISDNEDRIAAVRASWKAFSDAYIAAKAEYKADVKAAWSAHATAADACDTDDDDDNDETDDNDKKKNKDNSDNRSRGNGHKLGHELKKWLKHDVDVKARGNVRLDLSL